MKQNLYDIKLTIYNISVNTHTASVDPVTDFLPVSWLSPTYENMIIIQLIFNFIFSDFLGCKLLYKHDLGKRWGSHCKMCSYCLQTSPKLIQNNLGGKVEDFCCEECMSKYTVLFYQVKKNIHIPGFGEN